MTELLNRFKDDKATKKKMLFNEKHDAPCHNGKIKIWASSGFLAHTVFIKCGPQSVCSRISEGFSRKIDLTQTIK